MLRLLTALLAGIFVGGVGLDLLTDAEGIAWIWPTTLPFLIIGLTLALVGNSLRGVLPLKDEQVRALLDQNLGALARITGIKRTGTSINDAPLCELDLVVAPFDRGAYATTVRALVDPVEIPRFQPGSVVVVARLRADRPEVSLIREPDAEWRRRANTESDRIPRRNRVSVWEADHRDAPGPRSLVGVGPEGRGQRLTAYAVLFVVGVAIVLGPNASAL
ncbi:hypothetical protein [Stackebrandtia nassauensis]|uniref:Uncharacterized protein n=1 Tax=Stackebrandtia nassauensis (strain DSM 44728 / CIP 108903 / NRRL B-16338 / NBRC 102104 / LLR-40K-21) TaxID=446470 RepID=D3Q905_STANL|nr:hypothetical protein [Stackebrandtia nassauensis]ADD40614.1 hypothetical protein Snas_0903 [Stackebrandtia nassauensis DSM 44728]